MFPCNLAMSGWLENTEYSAAPLSRRDSYTKLMKGRKADAVFVDLPYNVAIDGHVNG
jgi:hypothetical protein